MPRSVSLFVLFLMFQVQQGIGKPSVYHAVVVIFLEFFAWGLLTTPMLTVSPLTLYSDLVLVVINAFYWNSSTHLLNTLPFLWRMSQMLFTAERKLTVIYTQALIPKLLIYTQALICQALNKTKRTTKVYLRMSSV